MENRTHNARVQVRLKEKEKELFYELCKKNKLSVQHVLREFILDYIRGDNKKC